MSKNTEDDRPHWAQRIRAERQARGWTQQDAVRALRAHSDRPLPDDTSMLRQWKNWEAGKHFPESYQSTIAAMFGTVTAAFFQPPIAESSGLYVPTTEQTLDLVERLRRSDVSAATLDTLDLTIERLCTDYAFRASDELRTEALGWLAHLDELLGTRLTLAQHRDILVKAGWLTLLVGCVEYDMRLRGAESTRRLALQLGQESEHADIEAWGHEIRAWMALTQGQYRAVIEASRQGQAAAPRSSVAVQLAAQEAKAWARVGDRRQVELALDQGRRLLERLPYPDNIGNHFTVDPDKFDFYAMDCYRRVGENSLALVHANEVIHKSTAPDGRSLAPMRIAEAQITQAVVSARQGNLEEAVHVGTSALGIPRQSVPSLLMVGSDLTHELTTRYPNEPATTTYLDRLRSLAQSP